MGGRVITLMAETEAFELVGAIEAPSHPYIGEKVSHLYKGPWANLKIEEDLARVLSKADVVIEFSSPRATVEHFRLVSASGKAAVIGTTGLSSEDQKEIEKLANQVPCVLAPNMSAGVNLMLKLVLEAAQTLGPDYDVEIYEAHHRMKRDAPSGTALKIAQVIAQALGRDLTRSAVYQRKGDIGPRSKEEIGIQAIRAGDIVGDHTVLFAGTGERLEIIHRANSRDTFAKGALRAAQWVVNQPSGLYNMQDVLGLKGI